MKVPPGEILQRKMVCLHFKECKTLEFMLYEDFYVFTRLNIIKILLITTVFKNGSLIM